MLQVGSFVLWHEFKYRSFCVAISILASIILQFIYMDSILLYPIHLVFFFHYYMHFNSCTNPLYYTTFNDYKLAFFRQTYIFSYPEVEYTNNILDSYYIFYVVFFILLIILFLPLLFYQMYIYMRPAMYIHEINFLNRVILYIFCLINLSFIVSFKQFIFFINNLTYNSYNYMEIHINFDLLQIFSYFILLLLFNVIYLFILTALLFRFTLHYFIQILGFLIICYILYHSITILPYTIIVWYLLILLAFHELNAYIFIYKHSTHEKLRVLINTILLLCLFSI